jgi:hypothetical protein
MNDKKMTTVVEGAVAYTSGLPAKAKKPKTKT